MIDLGRLAAIMSQALSGTFASRAEAYTPDNQLSLGTTAASARTALELGNTATNNRATQSAAEDGVNNTAVMSPLRTTQHLNANVVTAITLSAEAARTALELGDLAEGDDAADVPYDNAGSGLSAENVQEAVDELDMAVSVVPNFGNVGTSFTLGLEHAKHVVSAVSGSPVVVTVPPNSTAAFPVGTTITIRRGGSGEVTVAEGSGVSFEVQGGRAPAARATNSPIGLYKLSADVWWVFGDLADE